ncbi:hypothetical protein PAMA_021801 [Pampus argenteus]
MEGDWRNTQNTRRTGSGMERFSTARTGGICGRFITGSCRFGPRCNYRHEWPVASQICRYFQKGRCWYGNRCRYLHILQPEDDAAVAGRRASMPTVSSSGVPYAPPGRRGSEPTVLQTGVTVSSQERSTSHSHSVVNVSNPQHNTRRVAADIVEEQSQDTDSQLTASWESVQRSGTAQAGAIDGQHKQETSSNDTEDVGAAAASTTQGELEEMEAFLQSKNVTCGICMDKVYEKVDSRNHVFGILPNCNHSFCLQCIRTWRKTKDLGPDVIKTCPQCRVRSAFYVPNKYWVEGQQKERLIATFKEKFSKQRCSYYTRYRCCPFKTECLYQHDKTARRRSFPYLTEDEDDYDGVDLLNFFIAMSLLSGDDTDEDDFDFPFY